MEEMKSVGGKQDMGGHVLDSCRLLSLLREVSIGKKVEQGSREASKDVESCA